MPQPKVVSITSKAKDYAPAAVVKRYISYRADKTFRLAEVGANPAYDILQAVVSPRSLSKAVRVAAMAQAFGAVEIDANGYLV